MLLEDKCYLHEGVMSRLLAYKEVDPVSGCWNWTKRRDKYGYGKISLKRKQKAATGNITQTSETVIRVVYTMFKGSIGAGLVVRHTCDNSSCINPDHLIIGTPKDNTQDAVKQLRHVHGTRHHLCVLDEDKVRSIRLLLPSTSDTDIADMYGISPGNVWFIRRGRIWKHVK